MVKLHRFYVNQQYLVDGELEWQWLEQSTTTLRYDLDLGCTDSGVYQNQSTDRGRE